MTDIPKGTPAEASPEEVDELECLKIETLAKLWEVSKRTIEKLIYDGELPSHKVGWNRRILRRDAIAYMQRQSCQHSQPKSTFSTR